MSLPTKNWKIHSGVLGFTVNESFVIPVASEIYEAIFENKYCALLNADDASELKEILTFSPFPVEIKLLLTSTPDSSIYLKVVAFNYSDEQVEIAAQHSADHIVIENTWFPFIENSLKELTELLNSMSIQLGKLSFKQYLKLIQSLKSELIDLVNLRAVKATHFDNEKIPVKAELYPYQLSGINWLKFLSDEQLGGILADEMGLGKTLQVIALIASLPLNSKTLVISPATLLENWRREFEKFAPAVTTLVHQGRERTGFPLTLSSVDVVITSYDTAIRDNSLLNRVTWKVIICDEAQAIKNPNAKRTKSVKRLNSECRFAVTGTPLENSLTDLWSIMDFSVDGFLGDQVEFESSYMNDPSGAELLERIISPLILRRLVKEVASDLPEKIEIPQILQLSEAEIDGYEDVREQTILEFKKNASLVTLSRLRMFCAHPFLLNGQNGDPAIVSTKYNRLIEIIEEIVLSGSKAILFTSYNRMNDIIREDISTRFGIFCTSIDGRTPVSDRQRIIDSYSKVADAALLVLNPIAAGAGLNITAANHVIHYNLEWNPAKEDQATARAYRRGQVLPVTIHRLYYADTIEEGINERLSRKRELSNAAVVGVKGMEEDYQDLLKILQYTPKKRI